MRLAVLFILLVLAGCTSAEDGRKAPGEPLTGLLNSSQIEARVDEFAAGRKRQTIQLTLEHEDLHPMRTYGEAAGAEGDVFLGMPACVLALNDSLYFCDVSNNTLVVADREGRLIRHIGGLGEAPGEFQSPTEIVANDRYVFVHDMGNGRIQIFNHQFEYQTSLSAHHGRLSTMAVTNRHLFLPDDHSRGHEFAVSVHDAEPPFELVERVMPDIIPPGAYPPFLNVYAISAREDGGFVVAARALPYVFSFDNEMKLKHVVELKHPYLDETVSDWQNKVDAGKKPLPLSYGISGVAALGGDRVVVALPGGVMAIISGLNSGAPRVERLLRLVAPLDESGAEQPAFTEGITPHENGIFVPLPDPNAPKAAFYAVTDGPQPGIAGRDAQ